MVELFAETVNKFLLQVSQFSYNYPVLVLSFISIPPENIWKLSVF